MLPKLDVRSVFLSCILSVVVLVKFGIGATFFAMLPFGLVTFSLVSLDVKYKLLPNRIIFPTYAVTLLVIFVNSLFESNLNLFFEPLTNSIFAFLIGISFIWFSRGNFGAGDVKLMALCGLVLGLNSFTYFLITLIITFSLLFFTTILLLIFRFIKLSTKIPFGPFLIIGTWFVIFLLIKV